MDFQCYLDIQCDFQCYNFIVYKLLGNSHDKSLIPNTPFSAFCFLQSSETHNCRK